MSQKKKEKIGRKEEKGKDKREKGKRERGRTRRRRRERKRGRKCWIQRFTCVSSVLRGLDKV